MRTNMMLNSWVFLVLLATPTGAWGQTGWQETACNVECPHMLPNNYTEVFDIEAPPATQKMRIHFAYIQMEKGYDQIEILDDRRNVIETITGEHEDYLSLPIYGSSAQVRVTTDDTGQSWGFLARAVRHRGCQPVQASSAALSRTSTCQTLVDQIRETATQEIHDRFSQRQYWGLRPTILESDKAGADHSETNLQVGGVDEADIVKTDGTHIYAVAGRQLRMFKVFPVEHTFLHYVVDIEGIPREMFIEDGRVVVISAVTEDQADEFTTVRAMLYPYYWGANTFTKITVFDTTSGAPHMSDEFLLSGSYKTARRVGQSYRFVLSRMLRWPQLQYQPLGTPPGTHEYEDELDRLEVLAVDTVRERTLAEWLPSSYRVEAGQRIELPPDCSQFLYGQANSTRELTSVVTLDFSGQRPEPHDATMFLQGGEVYQNQDSLYISSRFIPSCYNRNFPVEGGQTTHLHKFTTSSAARSEYRVSGVVSGFVRDQFAMDEHNGYLRIATSNRNFSASTPEERLASQVFVLGEDGDQLRVEGMTELLAPGESLFGTRFLGDLGFLVTFRRVDPLFTLDLSNPANPRVLGELTVPGFSTYLHPLAEDYLFAIGNDFNEDGTTRNGVALSIFDVSDLSEPRLAHKAVVGTRHGRSTALNEHRAFSLYRPEQGSDAFLAIPFTDYLPGAQDYWSRFLSTLKLFRVSTQGIIGAGEIDMSDMFAQAQENVFRWWYRPNVKRGLFVDGHAFAVSDVGIRAIDLLNPESIVAEVYQPVQNTLPDETLRMSATEMDWPNAFIPGWWWGGLTRHLDVSADLPIEKLSVWVDIRHGARGDLIILLQHEGQSVILHFMEGGHQDDLVQTYHLEDFVGSAQGQWTLRVFDMRWFNTGSLVEWGITVKGELPKAASHPR